MISNFKNKTALLTGAGSGFGLECARIGAQLGMNLVLIDVQQDALDKTAAEAVVALRFRRPGSDERFNFEKVSKRTHHDVASVNSAISLKMQGNVIAEARLAFGGVAPVPLFLKKTPAFLLGKNLDAIASEEFQADAEAVLQSEISPISDVRGSAAYKRLLARQLLRAHFIELFPEFI